MTLLRSPAWLSRFQFPYDTFQEIPPGLFQEVNARLDALQDRPPLVSILIAAWNEEANLLACVASLANSATKLPVEVIVVNNNSTDNTQRVIDQLHVQGYFQQIQGAGPARQLGQENARGTYILLADADCIYPPDWINEMMQELRVPGVAGVYGRYSFIPEPGFPRWQLFAWEKMKDVAAALRHVRRPYLNAYGISMGYVREFGLRAGFIMHNTRGEDGRLCFDLMQFGTIRQVKADKARPWTQPRTLKQDGSLSKGLFTRIFKELSGLGRLLVPHPPHDTKTSRNE